MSEPGGALRVRHDLKRITTVLRHPKQGVLGTKQEPRAI
jgi:hypothetical protein